MKTKQKIQVLEKAISILEGIQTFERLKESNLENRYGIYSSFPSLTTKSIHQDEIYTMCITRLNERLKKQLELVDSSSFSEEVDEDDKKYQFAFHEEVMAGLNSF
jgi:hypothetical protein